jgi:hypothetical protein
MSTIESKKPLPKFKEAIMPKSLYAHFVGIGVSKLNLDVYETKNKNYFTLSNDKTGVKQLLKHIKPNPDILVLIDLTG